MTKETHNIYINSMRSMAVQAIRKAGQGHTGMAMSAAPITYTLFTKHINIAQSEPKWINRDRFVMSAGHGSMCFYPILCFAGLITLEDIKQHKQEGSHTPGHPEKEDHNHVDASTGPLGQGISLGVGMALAAKYLSHKFKNLTPLLDHYTYVLVGDGCLEEGIGYEAMSLAGTLQLSKLIFIHDSNDMQLDSDVRKVFTENLQQRVEAQGYFYQRTGNSPAEIDKAILAAKQSGRPAFIEVKTIIGEGLKVANTNLAHGAAINDEEIKSFENYYHMKVGDFQFEKNIYDHFATHVTQRGTNAYEQWRKQLAALKTKHPTEVQEFLNWVNGDFFPGDQRIFDVNTITIKDAAVRDYVGKFFAQLDKKEFDFFLNGSADLAMAVKNVVSPRLLNDDINNREIRYGVREFSMAGIQNGILLHGGLKSLASTFLVFADYMKPALRLGTLMKLPTIYMFSHDSYSVGGDGPTHQPFDQLPMLRAINNFVVHRPCDQHELAAALNASFRATKQSHAIVTTRQPIPSFAPRDESVINRGGYVLREGEDFTICASGSEVGVAVATAQKLEETKVFKSVKVVSVPDLKGFLENDATYIRATLKSRTSKVLCVEASAEKSWYEFSKYGFQVAHQGAFTYGLSMDGNKLYADKGFNVANLVAVSQKWP